MLLLLALLRTHSQAKRGERRYSFEKRLCCVILTASSLARRRAALRVRREVREVRHALALDCLLFD